MASTVRTQPRFSPAGVLLVLALLLTGLLPLPPAQAQEPPEYAAGVAPPGGTVGTTFTFFYDGWGDNEDYIDYWLIGPGERDNFEEGQFDNEPDANGRTTWTWTAPPGVWSGTWTMHARGLRTYDTVAIPFELVGDTLPPPARSGVTPPGGTVGIELTFFTDAWPKGDVIDSWILPPGSDEPFWLGRHYGDPNEEGFTEWEWEIPPDAWGGTWTMNARGYYSQAFVQIPFTIIASPPPEIGATVAPTAAFPGQTLDLFANGFQSGESISFWVNAPTSNRPVFSNGEDELFADESGTAAWQWTLPESAAAGAWSVVVLGRESYREHRLDFTVVAEGSAAPGGPTLEASPARGVAGSTFTFSAAGFSPKEQIQYWFTQPNGEPIQEGEVLTYTDSTGLAVWTWPSPAAAPGGVWVLTAQGTRNREMVQTSFVIVATAEAARPTEGVSPEEAGAGSAFAFFAEGFLAEERVSWWATSPSREVLPGELELLASPDGRLEWVWNAPTNAEGGEWFMIAKGVTSGREKRIPFVVLREGDAPPPPAPASVAPEAGLPGDTFAFRAEGLPPGAKVTFWATDPQGVLYSAPAGEDRLTVADDGSATWAWTAPAEARPGPWLMRLQSVPGGDVVGNVRVTIRFEIGVP